jgi:hypothetical protein
LEGDLDVQRSWGNMDVYGILCGTAKSWPKWQYNRPVRGMRDACQVQQAGARNISGKQY